jgi:hypothetical protein
VAHGRFETGHVSPRHGVDQRIFTGCIAEGGQRLRQEHGVRHGVQLKGFGRR